MMNKDKQQVCPEGEGREVRRDASGDKTTLFTTLVVLRIVR